MTFHEWRTREQVELIRADARGLWRPTKRVEFFRLYHGGFVLSIAAPYWLANGQQVVVSANRMGHRRALMFGSGRDGWPRFVLIRLRGWSFRIGGHG